MLESRGQAVRDGDLARAAMLGRLVTFDLEGSRFALIPLDARGDRKFLSDLQAQALLPALDPGYEAWLATIPDSVARAVEDTRPMVGLGRFFAGSDKALKAAAAGRWLQGFADHAAATSLESVCSASIRRR